MKENKEKEKEKYKSGRQQRRKDGQRKVKYKAFNIQRRNNNVSQSYFIEYNVIDEIRKREIL